MTTITQTTVNIPTSGNLQLNGSNVDLSVILGTTTISNDSMVEFTNFSSVYNKIIVEFSDIVTATDSVNINYNFGTGGSADSSSVYAESLTSRGFDGSSFIGGPLRKVSLGNTIGRLTVDDSTANLGTGTGEHFGGYIVITNPNSTTNYKSIYGFLTVFGDSPHINYISVSSVYKSTSALNYFRVLASSGNLASGTIKFLGCR